MSLPHIFTLCQTVWELWPAQDICFMGDNSITMNMVVSPASDMPTGPCLNPYHIPIITLSQTVMASTKFWLQGK